MKKNKNNYIDNQKLMEEVSLYRKEYYEELELSEKEGRDFVKPVLTNYIGKCIMDIANGLASKGNFGGYTYKDEMISDGIENCIRYIHNFNPEKTDNAFAYITMILSNAFIARIQREKKQTYVKYKSMIASVDTSNIDPDYMSKINEFILEYETKLAEKKAKEKKKKVGIELFEEGD